jgi:hypothetical protein
MIEMPARYRPFDQPKLTLPMVIRNMLLGKIFRKTSGLGENSRN